MVFRQSTNPYHTYFVLPFSPLSLSLLSVSSSPWLLLIDVYNDNRDFRRQPEIKVIGIT